ncbi:Uncharacterised protein [Raoultella terrigena]|uniref:YchJ-like middle NTF2-like domain-containing protein n=1 Tax=Raoultella terrigena TaxID=577 RepID=A0A3P8M0A3_RAOTE|nr:Uncharacterised protein [Raoultella terrigena]
MAALCSIAHVASVIWTARCQRQAPSQLMRSRYSAFVMKDADYLIKTWHPSCQAQQFRADLESGFAKTRWLGLTVFAADEGRNTDEGFVSFIARFNDDNRSGRNY